MNKQTKIGNGIRSIAGSVLAIMMLSMLLMDSVSLNAFADGTDNTPFEVTQSVYERIYKNDPNYVVVGTVPYYQYATRTKATKTDGHDTLSGWTKYDTKTSSSTSGYKFGTPVSTSTSYANGRKTVTSAVSKGYYYYAYAVANPNKTSDWTYYVDKTRTAVINHMKASFSSSATWDEARLRYFWYISSKDLGSLSGKFNKSIPYCADSTVSKGVTTKSGDHLYDLKLWKYKQCYKVKTDITINYYYQWSAWSAWSAWSRDRRTLPSDGSMKENSETRYLIRLSDSAASCVHQWNSTYTVDVPSTINHTGIESIHCKKCGAVKPGTARETPVIVLNSGSGSWIDLAVDTYYEVRSTAIPVVRITKIKAKKGSMVAKWKKSSKKQQAKFSGYQIQYSTKRNFTGKTITKGTAKTGSKQVVIRRLKRKTTYYVRMRRFRKEGDNVIFSNWSKVRKVKIK